MSTYLRRRGARLLGGEPADLVLEDGVIAEVGTGLTRAGAEVVDADGLVALPGLVDLHTHLREPGREDAETVETGTAAAALGGFTAVHAMANTDPVADTAGVVEQVWRLGREAGHCDVRPVGAVTVGLAGQRLAELGAMADSRRPGAGVLRRRALRLRRGADAPRAGVRQGVRRRRRPARAGAAAHRGRPDERGRAVRRARPAGLAGGRRGGDHRPRRAARRPRRLAAARLPRVDRGLGRDPALGQVEGLERHRRGDPAPPAADRRAGHAPTTRSSRSTRRCAPPTTSRRCATALADGTIDAVATDHAPHAHEDKDCEWAAAAMGMLGLETALSVVQEAMVETGLLDWAGVADRMSVRPARIGLVDGHGRPLEVGAPANLVLVDPAARRDDRPVRAGLAVAQHAVRRPHAARRRGRDLPPRPRRPSSTGSSAVTAARSAGAAGAGGRPDVPRRVLRRDRRDVRRGGVLHRHDRLPGDADRPVATTARSS